MREWIEAQLKAGLPAFAGSKIAGTLAVKQELINELLAQWLADTTQPSGTVKTLPDLSQSKNVVKEAVIRAEPGVVLVDFKIAI